MAAVLPSDNDSYFTASGLGRLYSHFNFISSISLYSTSFRLREHYKPTPKSYIKSSLLSTPLPFCTVYTDLVNLSYVFTFTANLFIAFGYNNTISLIELPKDYFIFLFFI
jgi:hypothetical protein